MASPATCTPTPPTSRASRCSTSRRSASTRRSPRLNAETEARAIVDDAVSRFRAQALEQSTTPALVALRKHVFGILDDEIDRVKRRGDTTPESAEQTERALRHLVGVLLHRPSVRARELGRAGRGDDFTGALDALFGVRPEPVADVPSAVVPLASRVRDDEADAS